MKTKKTISSLFSGNEEWGEEYLSLDEFSNTSYDDLIEGETIIPEAKESRKMERIERDKTIINWLLKPYKQNDEKQFKKLGKRFFEEKKYIEGFKNRYKQNPSEFKKNRYSAYIKWIKNKN